MLLVKSARHAGSWLLQHKGVQRYCSERKANTAQSLKHYRPQILLYASEISVVCGSNPFRCISDVFLANWSRAAKEDLELLQVELQSQIAETIEEQVDKIIEDVPVLKEIIAKPKLNTTHVVEARKLVQEQVKAITKLSDDEKKAAQEVIVSTMNKDFGTLHEEYAVHSYETQTGKTVNERNARFWVKTIGTSGIFEVKIGGRIDGRSGDKVIEVKNRIKQFKTPIPKYDLVQLQTYLFLLNSNEGEIVEYLKSDKNGKSKTTSVEWNQAQWDSHVYPYLARFSNSLNLFLQQPILQEEFLINGSDKRKEIIRNLWMQSPPTLE